MIFNRPLFLGSLIFLVIPLGGTLESSHLFAQGNDEQYKIFRQQKLLGKGEDSKRRYEKILKKAGKEFANKNYESAALLYFNLLENPEFSSYLQTEEIEYRMVESLTHAQINNVALETIQKGLSRGPKSSHFIKHFQLLVEILNRTRSFQSIDPIITKLQKTFGDLPARVREDSHYLYGRKDYFNKKFNSAKKEFSSISYKSPFYSRALYHLGLIATLQGNLSEGKRYFDEATTSNEGEKIKDYSLLALSRVNYTLDRAKSE